MPKETYIEGVEIHPGEPVYDSEEGAARSRASHFAGEMVMQLLDRLHRDGHITPEEKSAALRGEYDNGLASTGVEALEWSKGKSDSPGHTMERVIGLSANAGYAFSVELVKLEDD